MKKLMTFAFMALLIGGFAYNANAQVATTTQQKKVEKSEVKSEEPQVSNQKPGKVEELNKTLTEYEQAVDNCVSIYQMMKDNTQKGKDYTKEFDSSLAKAEKLKAQLEKYRLKMDRTQVDRLNKANEKLSKIMIK